MLLRTGQRGRVSGPWPWPHHKAPSAGTSEPLSLVDKEGTSRTVASENKSMWGRRHRLTTQGHTAATVLTAALATGTAGRLAALHLRVTLTHASSVSAECRARHRHGGMKCLHIRHLTRVTPPVTHVCGVLVPSGHMDTHHTDLHTEFPCTCHQTLLLKQLQ